MNLKLHAGLEPEPPRMHLLREVVRLPRLPQRARIEPRARVRKPHSHLPRRRHP